MKFGIITFPGSNCDYDAFHAVTDVLGEEATYLWHKDHDLQGSDVIILPGGFSYGDYLRVGAIARFSPIMREVVAHAKSGGPVLESATGSRSPARRDCFPGLDFASTPHFVSQVGIRVENANHVHHLYEQGEIRGCHCPRRDGRTFGIWRLGSGRTLSQICGRQRQYQRGRQSTARAQYRGILAMLVTAWQMPHPDRAAALSLPEGDAAVSILPMQPERAVTPRPGDPAPHTSLLLRRLTKQDYGDSRYARPNPPLRAGSSARCGAP